VCVYRSQGDSAERLLGADAVDVGADALSASALVQKHDDGIDGADDVGFLSQRVDFGHDGGLVWHCHGSANVVERSKEREEVGCI
jgi:hypothetical protein